MRNLKKCPSECKKTAYVALVRSTLEYGAVVWDPMLQKDIFKLEKINRKAARFIKGDFKTRIGRPPSSLKCVRLAKKYYPYVTFQANTAS